MKKLIYLIVFLTILFTNISFGSFYNDEGYSINKYNIDITVNENNTFDITEEITANFSLLKHGIYREIPLVNDIKREDGTNSKKIAKITNVWVNDKYTIKKDINNYIIKIGDKNNYIIGDKKYTIKYTYNIGKDPLKDIDELYFNIIGTKWNTDISNITFSIKMPKDFDKSKIGFSTGAYQLSGSNKIEYDVIGNTIIGRYNGKLSYNEGITIRTELPEGYFVGTHYIVDYIDVLKLFILIILTFISYMLWKKYGKDEKAIETVEFYPPEGLNSAELAYAFYGTLHSKDSISLLIYLANKGYLKIEEFEEKLFKFSKPKKAFKIIKIKEYDGENQNEKIFLEGLFKEKDEVSKWDLMNKFYLVLGKVCSNIHKEDNEEKIFEKASLGKRTIILIMLIITLVLFNIWKIIIIERGLKLIFIILWLLSWVYFKPNKLNVVLTILIFIFVLLLDKTIAFFYSPVSILLFILKSICSSLMIIFLGIIKKRTKYGINMYGRIKGFRNFLMVAEKQKLEELVNENPEYFYNILPFTYVLRVSKVWMKKFEDISIQSPNWYYSNTSFSKHSFNNFMNTTYSSISTSMSSAPNRGRSGGGFSGGGSGGGGRRLLVRKKKNMEEKLIAEYIGKDSEKIMGSKINILAAILG